MGKTINSTVQAAIDSGEFAGVILAKLHFSPIRRYTNAYQSIYWDESGGGELEYEGLGNLASISVLEESAELSAQTIQLTISGIPNDTVTDIFGDDYIGEPVYLWYATLNKTTYAVEGGQNGPVLIFAGRMDYGTMTFGDTATISVNATSRLADWERARGGRFNHEYQLRHVDITDYGFYFVQSLQNKPISWGGVTITDPGTSSTNAGDERACFDIGTKFYMQDYSLKEIQDIIPGDIMLYGGLVQGIIKSLGHKEQWYDYKGITVTSAHSVLENGEWLLIKDSINAIKTSTKPFTYILDNANHIMIAENKEVFTDYHVVPYEMRQELYKGGIELEYLNSRVELNKELEQLKL